MRLTPSSRGLLSMVCLCSLSVATPAQAALRRGESPVPDFTAGGEKDDKHDWNLGPTGARGWMWGYKLQTSKARQILVTEVAAGSPADGKLQVGDVILGVSEESFAHDPRMELGTAIGEAEAGSGELSLIRWREGETSTVVLPIGKKGAYSENSPFDCEKSQQILAEGCAHIAKRLEADFAEFRSPLSKGPDRFRTYSSDDIMNAVDAMALLASGKPEYATLVTRYAHAFAPVNLEIALHSHSRMASWGWGYINLFLCEYFLATGDEAVLPAIELYTTNIAKGQSFIGSWGHAMAWPDKNAGKLHGVLSGYGALNSAGLICHLSLVLGKECGVKTDEVDDAIAKANKFIGFYANKGSIPYGDHLPNWDRHDDNGKNSMAAVLFDLQDQSERVRFFSKMTVASYGERERGHTGNYFSLLWGPLGARRAGSEATAAFMKPQRWFYDLNRSWDGSFPYQGGANSGKGEHSYAGWDSTGAFMLTYALPLKRLYITGRGTSPANQLAGSEVDSVITDGADFTVWDEGLAPYRKKTAEVLLQDLQSWSPAVRFRAAQALAEKEGSEVHLPNLIAMLNAENLTARYGACQGLAAFEERAQSAVEPLQALLWSEDTWLRIQAVSALSNIGEASKSAIPALLRLAIVEDESDPLEITQRYLALGLFDSKKILGNVGLLANSVENVDRDLLFQAVQKILTNPDGRTRETVASVYRNLSYEELKPLLPAILKAIKEPSPSGVMFASGIRINGIELLAKYRIEEGMALCLDILEIDKWGKRKRLDQCLSVLATYGGAAKPLLPRLRQLEKDLQVHPEATGLTPQREYLHQLIKDIETAEEEVELRSMKE
ncbi:DUF6288 domain-containing protein [Roseibacillus persicicus]|uniref:DUF6288 domain-containing protein n=1 Tax=Roseibacillus persicicus TaxID=454148 RepID=UPI00280D405F|nr:DUF6288 domain-containing protein [Roseibacillus persicicus]MDQ8190404.1 DUF6288 domain-containing protein [Roseibacillus persicicus]